MKKLKLFLVVLTSLVVLTAYGDGGGNTGNNGNTENKTENTAENKTENTGENKTECTDNSAAKDTAGKEETVDELVKVTVPADLDVTEYISNWAVMKAGEPWRFSVNEVDYENYPLDEPTWDSLVEYNKGLYDVKSYTLNSKEGIIFDDDTASKTLYIEAPINDKKICFYINKKQY